MSENETLTPEVLKLPSSIVSKLDLSRLVTEAERVDNELTEVSIRSKAGGESIPSPAKSAQLNDFLQTNNLSFDDDHRRGEIISAMRRLKDLAPVVTMTFAVVADTESLEQLTQWLRDSVHPQVLIASGLQPALIAGVYLRTPNRVQDFSLRTKLKNGRGLLVEKLEALRGEG